jgi:hypothetical protein
MIPRGRDPWAARAAAWLDARWWRVGHRLAPDPDARPRLVAAFGVPLTTWLRHPWWGAGSYRRHAAALRERAELADEVRRWRDGAP